MTADDAVAELLAGAGAGADARATFARLVDLAVALGPVAVAAEPAGIALRARTTAATIRVAGPLVAVRLVLGGREESALRLARPADVAAAVTALLAEAVAEAAAEPAADGEPPRATTADATLTAHLRELERILAERDVSHAPGADLAALLDDPFLEYGASGRRWDRPAMVAALATAVPGSVGIEGFGVRVVGPDRAIATYRSVIGGRRADRVSAWVRRDGRWRVRAHVGTPLA